MQKSEKYFEVKYSYLIFILIFFILTPPYFSSLSYYSYINDFLMIFIVLILFVLNIFKKRINMFILITTLFSIWNIFSSYYFAGGVLDLFNNIKIYSIVLLVNIFIKNHIYSLLKALNLLFSTYIYLNFITFILLPNGLYLDNPRSGEYRSAWFLGIENQFAYIIIPGITIILLYTFYKNNRVNLNSILAIIVAGVTILFSWSATGVVSYIFLVGVVFYLHLKGTRKILNYHLLAISYAIVWFVVVRINSYDFFQNIIVNILNKDMTFSSRTLIWDKAFEQIPLSLWYGYGNNSVVEFATKDFRTHNLILQIILDNGLISLFIFTLLVCLIGYHLIKVKININITILVIGMFALLIGGLAESYQLNNLFLIMILLYNSKYFINKNVTPSYIGLSEGLK